MKNKHSCSIVILGSVVVLFGVDGCNAYSNTSTIFSDDSPVDNPPVDNPPVDRPLTLDDPLHCDSGAQFQTPMLVESVFDLAQANGIAHWSTDESVILYSAIVYGQQDPDLLIAIRPDRQSPFLVSRALSMVNGPSPDTDPMVNADTRTLWFSSQRVAQAGFHIYTATSRAFSFDFERPMPVSFVNGIDSSINDRDPFISSDDSELWFSSDRMEGVGGRDIWRSQRTGNDFDAPVSVRALNSDSDEEAPVLSADGLTVYFASSRAAPNASGGKDIWMAHRVSDGSFSPPVLVGGVNTSADEYPSALSLDNCRLYLVSSRDGSLRSYMASRKSQ